MTAPRFVIITTAFQVGTTKHELAVQMDLQAPFADTMFEEQICSLRRRYLAAKAGARAAQ